jgi:acetolactate synthase-1/2/3 large subunit
MSVNPGHRTYPLIVALTHSPLLCEQARRLFYCQTLSSTKTKNKASDLLVAALESEGVERIFGVPGEENLDVLESLRTSKIKFIVTRHEQSAAFMAATCGRLMGKPGVCLSTLGPGALNFSTGAAYALLGAMPMILITGQ